MRKPKPLRPLQPGVEPGTMLVPLTRGKFAVIDESDAEAVGKYNWFYTHRHTCEYAARTGTIMLHWAIVGKPERGLVVDHIDRNGLNNRRGNLRIVTHAVNMQNRAGLNPSRATGVLGVYSDKRCFRVEVRSGSQRLRKCCQSLEEGARIRDEFRARLGIA